MTKQALSTFFAPAERADSEALYSQHKKLVADPLVVGLLDSFPEPAMILNKQRQIVLANDKLARALKRPREGLLGLRPGEAFGCIHSTEDPGGCGTTRFCRHCGAANAFVNSQRFAEGDVQEWRIQSTAAERSVPYNLRVWATPLTIRGESFTVFAMRDTTDEKRRQALEQIFFHDLLNTANALSLMLHVLPELHGQEAVVVSRRAPQLVNELADEIHAQRDLAAAERGDLLVRSVKIDARELLQRVCEPYSHRSTVEGISLVVPESHEPVVLESDERLLSRVLGNLIKNAFEASRSGQTVTASVDGGVIPTFSVHNESTMAEEVQAQIFQRCFSTKSGVGRGLGTYSVKLLTEQYLRGKVEFRSTVAEGTTFSVRLPLRLSPAEGLAERYAV